MGRIAGIICKRLYNIPARILCIITVVIQAYIVNHYLVEWKGEKWYAWYAADAVSVAVLIAACVDSYRHVLNMNRGRPPTKGLFGGKLGLLPLVYISWLIYSLLLVIRVAIIFRDIAPHLKEEMMFGPNMLKTGLSLSSIVFFLHVATHIDAEPEAIREDYVTGIIGRITVDVLDCVQFLSPLFITESRLIISFELHHTIIAIGCLNLLLPTIKLGILSGYKLQKKKMAKILETAHLVAYLLIINVPMLTVRILIWSVHSQDISVFIIKNILSLCLTYKAIHDHCIEISSNESDGKKSNEHVELSDKMTHPATEEHEDHRDQEQVQLHGEGTDNVENKAKLFV